MKAQTKIGVSSLRTFAPWRLGVRMFCLSLVVILSGLLAGCRSMKQAAPVEFFSDSISAPGWAKSGAARTFEASHLWEYVDGDADKYLQAGVLKTLTCDYKFSNKTDATVDVYVMGNAAGARKIYDGESSDGSQPLSIGDASRYAKGSLTFRQGPYFVRLVAYEDSPEITKALTAMALAVSNHLNQAGPGT
jgi:hypothetical protein